MDEKKEISEHILYLFIYLKENYNFQKNVLA